MKKQKKISLILSLFSLLPTLLFFRNPVDKNIMTSAFGESRGDHFHNGIDLSGKDLPVYPISKGKIFLFRDKSVVPFEHPIGLGNYVFIKNGEYYTFYCHLQNKINADNITVTTDTIIGYTGNTGHSTGYHLHLSIMDQNMNYINPCKLLPKIKDNTTPVIKEVYINNKRIKNTKLNISNEQILQISAFDYYGNTSYKIYQGVYKIYYTLNNIDKFSLTFDTLKKNNDTYLLNGIFSFKEIYFNNKYILGRINSIAGPNVLRIGVEDFGGNRTETTIKYIGYMPEN